MLHYDAKPDHENEVLAARLVKLAHERRRFGYRRLHALVEREGTHANHKRIYRLYREAGLAVRRRRKRHGVMIEREQLALPGAPNEVWSIDFVMDALSSGRRVKCLTVVDDFTKEAVDIRRRPWHLRFVCRSGIGPCSSLPWLSQGGANRPGTRIYEPRA
ncbi:HTH-like domain protein [Burkholderia mallei]|nr:HTH-like domain protein [Burkholderia mallei]